MTNRVTIEVGADVTPLKTTFREMGEAFLKVAGAIPAPEPASKPKPLKVGDRVLVLNVPGVPDENSELPYVATVVEIRRHDYVLVSRKDHRWLLRAADYERIADPAFPTDEHSGYHWEKIKPGDLRVGDKFQTEVRGKTWALYTVRGELRGNGTLAIAWHNELGFASGDWRSGSMDDWRPGESRRLYRLLGPVTVDPTSDSRDKLKALRAELVATREELATMTIERDKLHARLAPIERAYVGAGSPGNLNNLAELSREVNRAYSVLSGALPK